MDCQNQAPRRWPGHADVQKKSTGPCLQSGGSCHWAPETGRCSGQVRPHLAGVLRLWSVDQREKAWLFWSQCWVKFFFCLKMKTSLLFPWQGGFSPMSGNVVDHQQDRMMEKCKLNQIGMKTNIMLWYQAIEALSIYLVLRTLLLGCLWTEPDIDLFLYILSSWTLWSRRLYAWMQVVVARPGLLEVLGIYFPTTERYHLHYFLLPEGLPLYYHNFNIYFWVFVKYILSLLEIPLNEKHSFRPMVPKLLQQYPGELQNTDACVHLPLSHPPKTVGCELYFSFFLRYSGDLMCSKWGNRGFRPYQWFTQYC